MKKETVFSAKNLSIGYSEKEPILQKIDLNIFQGQYCALLGSNGSGKTTFVRTIVGLMPALDGNFSFGKNISISMVPQFKKMKLEYPLTVKEVIFLSGNLSLFRKKKLFTNIEMKILKDIGVEALLDKLIRECSGGELQKIFIARSILSKANLIFLDEPMDALDKKSRETISDLLHTYSNEFKTTFFVITHNIEKGFIEDFDRIFQIENSSLKEKRGQGHVFSK